MKATTRLIPQDVPAPRVRTALELSEDDVTTLVEELSTLKLKRQIHPGSKLHELLSTVGDGVMASLAGRETA